VLGVARCPLHERRLVALFGQHHAAVNAPDQPALLHVAQVAPHRRKADAEGAAQLRHLRGFARGDIFEELFLALQADHGRSSTGFSIGKARVRATGINEVWDSSGKCITFFQNCQYLCPSMIESCAFCA